MLPLNCRTEFAHEKLYNLFELLNSCYRQCGDFALYYRLHHHLLDDRSFQLLMKFHQCIAQFLVSLNKLAKNR